MKLDLESLLAGLRSARHETIMAWSPQTDSDTAGGHLMNALLDIELAIGALQKAESNGSTEFRGMVAATQGRRVEQ